jgi:uncharacterized protein (TIGR02118 family)
VGQEDNVIVRMGMIRRLPSLTREQFTTHWAGPHGKLALRLPNLLRYHQNHVVRRFNFEGQPDRWELDGLSELWFPDIATMMASVTSPDYAGLGADTPSVMTMPGLLAGTVETVRAGHGPAKAMVVLGRDDSLGSDQFKAEWRARREAVASLAGLAGCNAIVISHRESVPGVLTDHAGLPVDMVLELWFDADASLQAALSGPLGAILTKGGAFLADASAYQMKTHVIAA